MGARVAVKASRMEIAFILELSLLDNIDLER